MATTIKYSFYGNGVDYAWDFPAYTGVPVVVVGGVAHAFTDNTPVGSYRIALTLDPGDPEADPDPIPAEEPPAPTDLIEITIAVDGDQGV